MGRAGPMPGDDRREDERYAVSLPALLRLYHRTPLAAQMVDISRGGAMLEAEGHDLAPGDEILLATHTLEIVATIAWQRPHFLGLVFHRRLDTHTLHGVRDAGQG